MSESESLLVSCPTTTMCSLKPPVCPIRVTPKKRALRWAHQSEQASGFSTKPPAATHSLARGGVPAGPCQSKRHEQQWARVAIGVAEQGTITWSMRPTIAMFHRLLARGFPHRMREIIHAEHVLEFPQRGPSAKTLVARTLAMQLVIIRLRCDTQRTECTQFYNRSSAIVCVKSSFSTATLRQPC